MSMTREQAWDLLTQYNQEEFHLRHAVTVELVMRWFARELGYDLPIELFDEINHKVPHLGNIFPSGAQLTESFWFAGGIPMVQWMLRDMLDLDVMTVTGKTLGENLEDLHKDNWFDRNLG